MSQFDLVESDDQQLYQDYIELAEITHLADLAEALEVAGARHQPADLPLTLTLNTPQP